MRTEKEIEETLEKIRKTRHDSPHGLSRKGGKIDALAWVLELSDSIYPEDD